MHNAVFAYSPAELADLAAERSVDYSHAQPFPHIVLDHLFQTGALKAAADSFPDPHHSIWRKFDNAREQKLGSQLDCVFPAAVELILTELNKPVFLKFLQQLTGIEGLIPDPYYRGGGMHQILPGGFLKIHTDFNRHEIMRVNRRLNVLIYLNEDWSEKYGGSLELWDADMRQCRQSVLPVINRMVVFNTNEQALHGHPDPLNCPDGRARKSLALYYYTSPSSDGEAAPPHSTLWYRREKDDFPIPAAQQPLQKTS